MNRLWTYIILLTLFSSCSVFNKERIYEGTYENDNISLHFINSKKGKFVVNEKNSIPFKYKIEKSKINPKTEKANNDKINFYVYRFTLNADFELNFPLGFYEIGQKGGDVLKSNNELTLVRKRN